MHLRFPDISGCNKGIATGGIIALMITNLFFLASDGNFSDWLAVNAIVGGGFYAMLHVFER